MRAAAAAAFALAPSRLAIATRSALSAARNPGRSRSLILATPRMPQRRLAIGLHHRGLEDAEGSEGRLVGSRLHVLRIRAVNHVMYPYRIRLRGPWEADPL